MRPERVPERVNEEVRSDLHDVTVKLVHTTDRAVLVNSPWRRGEHWFPLSHVEIAPAANGLHVLTAPEWLLVEKGWL